ncbi:MAG: HAD-IIB family hydrolase [Rhodospirillales bacterium]|nr:HAD-IIB family hydrolase [Rhodospirillales bacterium]
MKFLNEFSQPARRAIQGVLLDIDETLTTHGKLTAQAYNAMEALSREGILVVPVTGRPAGWCDHIARMWPVNAVVGENGSFYFRYDEEKKKLEKRFLQNEAERAAGRRKLEALKKEILTAVPGAAVASDQRYRESDLAIDFCEDVPPLPRSAVERIATLFARAGATAKISSIHVNGWFGNYDKLTMTRIMMEECFGIDLNKDRDRFVFIGDSPNDSPMFEFFPHSVGVANVRAFADRLDAEPAYVTEQDAGAGFAELAGALMAARR